MMLSKTFLAMRDCATLNEFLREDAALSATLIKRAKYGHIRLNGETVNTRAPVRAGDRIELDLPDGASPNIPPIEMPLDILCEDDDLIAVNKPRHMPVHPSRGNHLPTLANGLAAYYAPKPFTFRAINRLDCETSGIVLIAKNAWSAYRLAESMKAGAFRKEYLALVTGIPTPASGRIDAPIGRESDGSMKRIVREDGKRAVTDYEVIGAKGENAICRLRLLTGRTHQIRVHMAYIGHPLLFDTLYGENVPHKTYFLHAYRLSFPHPTDGHLLTLEAKAPSFSDDPV